jgi:hypothetical protein
MTISRNEAELALAEIERTATRSETLRGYQFAGPILMLWGLIWVIGYGAMGLLPVQRWGVVWILLDLLGAVLTIAMSRRQNGGGAGGWRSVAGSLAVVAFCGAVFAVFRPTSLDAYLAFPGLVAGTVYVVLGLWRMTRFVWIGAAMFAATLVGFFFLSTGLAFWMAATGGGGLVLGGLWLRKA